MAGSRSILVVGEGGSASEILKAAKDRSHWAVDHARSGSEGIASAEAKRYDVVVTELELPDMDGLALLTRIRARRPKAKVIVIAEESPPARVIEAIREHAFNYVSDPIDLESVLRAIERGLTIPDWEDGIEVVSALPHRIDLRVRCKKVSGDRLEHFLRAFRLDLPPGGAGKHRHRVP